MTESLQMYVNRNPLKADCDNKSGNGSRERLRERDKLLFGNGQNSRKYGDRCVYCGNNQHRGYGTRVLSIAGRREILNKTKLFYNCTGAGHSSFIRKPGSCAKCGQKNHTSMFDINPWNSKGSREWTRS